MSSSALGHGRHLAPEPLHVVAVQARGALQQLRGIHEVGRAALVHVHDQLREAAAEDARRARVVEVDVGQEQRPRLHVAEALQQGLDRGRGAGIHDHAVLLVGADHPVPAEVHHVDRPAHGPPTLQSLV